MMTLKDIKISKNRVPVQNAIWIRPIGGFKFKIYYPHGGDWEEMKFNDSSPSPSPDEDKDIEALEERVDSLDSQVESLTKSYARLNLKLENVSDNLKSLSLSVTKLYKSVDITAIELTKTPPLNKDNEDNDILKYGIDTISLNALVEGVVRKASIAGYDEIFAVTTVESLAPSAFIPHWLVVTMVLKEETKRTIVFLVGAARALIGAPIEIYYSLWREEQTIDNSVWYLVDGLPKETREQLTAEEFTAMGFTQTAVSKILDGTITKVLFGTDTIEYGIFDLDSSTDYMAFSIYGYDWIKNLTYYYECSGAENNNTWMYDVIFEEYQGNVVPEIEEQ